MKCDGNVASITNYPTENGSSFFSSSFNGCGLETAYRDPNNKKMVPCGAGSPPTYPGAGSPTYPRAGSPTYPGYGGKETNGDQEDRNVDGGKGAVGLVSQVSELQSSLVNLQQETEETINKLRQELADKASIVESLQQQIRMKMILNLAGGGGSINGGGNGNPVLQALAEFQGGHDSLGGGEDILSSWRKHLELLGGGQDRGNTPGSPHTVRSSTPLDGGIEGGNRPCSTPSIEDSPHRNTDSASPGKEEGVSHSPSPPPSSLSPPTLVPKSFANTMGSPLSVPPIFTNRIPKEDPLEERLHDMLRYNMEKFAGQPIDTLADSRRVREMLSVHNIGQRLFAKYVLGLSQGTVSELLSKPKSWDKLTEKGRDSYRKMHAWVWDDQAILLLKTLIPRKGELLRSASSKQVEDRSEDRINKILSEVNKSSSDHIHKPIFPHMDHPNVHAGLLLPGLPAPEELKMALSFYQAELQRNRTQEMKAEAAEAERESLREEKENQEKDEKPVHPFSLLHAKLDQGLLGIRPQLQVNQQQLFPPGFSVDSPLQRMASITNSLVSQPLPSPNFGQRPLKAVLPPITQQQFDMFSHLNTDDVVRRIKEILSQYSISQRLFGEAVLGLSQGSVSDLLARPKPWHMLTQKGREPFIRMKLFLDDDTAIHKLVASQYKILPDKLLRTGPYSGAPNIAMPPWQLFHSTESLAPMSGKLTTSHPQFRGIPDLPALIPNPGRLPPGLLPGMDRSMLVSLQQRHLVPNLPHLTPNLYELAALTQELDTLNVTNKIKETLLANNTGQKLFGEAVLGLSQGSVSELLSKPKPWHMLSIKGREPYVRMQMWLNDPTSIDKLMAIKKLQEETRKRKRTYDESYSGKSSPSDLSDIYSNPGYANSPDDGMKRMRESGLDLSFKRDEEDIAEDIAEDDHQDDLDTVSEENTKQTGRSRRKPLAPQWLNPGWGEDDDRADRPDTWEERRENWDDGEKDTRTINGVCVVNAAVFNNAEQRRTSEH